jgi:hypothetical protein
MIPDPGRRHARKARGALPWADMFRPRWGGELGRTVLAVGAEDFCVSAPSYLLRNATFREHFIFLDCFVVHSVA